MQLLEDILQLLKDVYISLGLHRDAKNCGVSTI
jgi:hypothetical protein